MKGTWQATNPKVRKITRQIPLFSLNFLSFFLLCIFLQHPHPNEPHLLEHQMHLDWHIGTWWQWVWAKIVGFTAKIGIAKQETMAVWIDTVGFMAMPLWASRLVLAEVCEIEVLRRAWAGETSGLIRISGHGSSDGLWIWQETSEYALKAVKESAMEALKASSPSSKLWKQPWCSSLIFYSLIFLFIYPINWLFSSHSNHNLIKPKSKPLIYCFVLQKKLFHQALKLLKEFLSFLDMGLEWLIIL